MEEARLLRAVDRRRREVAQFPEGLVAGSLVLELSAHPKRYPDHTGGKAMVFDMIYRSPRHNPPGSVSRGLQAGERQDHAGTRALSGAWPEIMRLVYSPMPCRVDRFDRSHAIGAQHSIHFEGREAEVCCEGEINMPRT